MLQGMTGIQFTPSDTRSQPMFFGQPLGSNAHPLSIQSFDKITQTQLSFFWRPDEVSPKRTGRTIKTSALSRNISSPLTSSTQVMLALYKAGPGMGIPYCELTWTRVNVEGFGIHGDDSLQILYPHYQEPLCSALKKSLIPFLVMTKFCACYNSHVSVWLLYSGGSQLRSRTLGAKLWKEAEPWEVWQIWTEERLFRGHDERNILEGIRFYVSFIAAFAFGELKVMEGSKDNLPDCPWWEPTPGPHSEHHQHVRVMILIWRRSTMKK